MLYFDLKCYGGFVSAMGLLSELIMSVPFLRDCFNKEYPQKKEIASLREKMSEYNKDWINLTTKNIQLSDLRMEREQNRYTIMVEGVPFECLYFPSETKRLIVSLNGGGAASRRYPNFLRWKHKNYYNGHFICIDDPMYFYHPGTRHVMWYYGDSETSYLKLLIKIVEEVISQLDIPRHNVFFLGSSGGGTAALFCANNMDNTNAIAMNPQIVLDRWQSPYIKEHFKEWGVDLSGEDKHNRNVVVLDNKTSRFAITNNIYSSEDYDKHFLDFCDRHKITPTYGISLHDNICTWVHATEYANIHSANPEKIGVSTLMFLLDKMRNDSDLNKKSDELNALSLLMNESLNENYMSQDVIIKQNYTLEKIAINSEHIVSFNNGKWMLMVNGIFNDQFTGVAKSTKGNYIFVKNGIYDPTFTGVAKSINGNWLYCSNGHFNKKYTGISVTTKGNKVFIKEGRWQPGFSGEFDGFKISNGYVV